MTPIFDWSYALEILPTLGAALVVTIQATVLGMLVAVTLGRRWRCCDAPGCGWCHGRRPS